jgi:hypothetical protein
LQNPPEDQPEITPEIAERMEMMRQVFKDGMPPKEVADRLFNAIRKEQFYVLTHPEFKERVQKRMENIINEYNPVFEEPSFNPFGTADQ